jgi:hypothetical protein
MGASWKFIAIGINVHVGNSVITETKDRGQKGVEFCRSRLEISPRLLTRARAKKTRVVSNIAGQTLYAISKRFFIVDTRNLNICCINFASTCTLTVLLFGQSPILPAIYAEIASMMHFVLRCMVLAVAAAAAVAAEAAEAAAGGSIRDAEDQGRLSLSRGPRHNTTVIK